ncbi:MAG: hypothetical protein EPO21_06880 [Chloroflexota bacterium]|nr:MAG: hypothetical protein EPO21_06880 [Chloroflexota bacterium]
MADKTFVDPQKPNMPEGIEHPSLKSYSTLQMFFLVRLGHLLRMRREWAGKLSADHWRLRLLSKAIYSTYQDCLAQGVSADAKSLFERERQAQGEDDHPEN